MKHYPAFETDRLRLKLTSEEDAPFILALLNSPNWIKYIGDRKVKTLSDAKAYIETKITPQYNKLGYANYTVIRKEDGAKMGTCGLYDRDGLDGIDIGFAFLPEFEHKGYAFEAAMKLLDFALSELNISHISAITTRDNYSSQKLMVKLGMHYKETVKIPNDDAELLLFVTEPCSHG